MCGDFLLREAVILALNHRALDIGLVVDLQDNYFAIKWSFSYVIKNFPRMVLKVNLDKFIHTIKIN